MFADIELRLDLGYRLFRFASRTNLKSVTRFAKICKMSFYLKKSGFKPVGLVVLLGHVDHLVQVFDGERQVAGLTEQQLKR